MKTELYMLMSDPNYNSVTIFAQLLKRTSFFAVYSTSFAWFRYRRLRRSETVVYVVKGTLFVWFRERCLRGPGNVVCMVQGTFFTRLKERFLFARKLNTVTMDK